MSALANLVQRPLVSAFFCGNVFPRYQSSSPATEERKIRPFSDIPGPKNSPFIGNALNLLKSAPGIEPDPKKMLEICKHTFHEFGPIVRVQILNRKSVFIFCPEITEKLFRTVGSMPHRPGFKSIKYVREKDSFFEGAKGLLSSQGEDWKQFRSKVQQPMLRPKSTLGYTAVLEEVAQEFVDVRIRQLRDGKNEMPEDFLQELYRWALESVACLALSTRLGCLNPNLRKDSEQLMVINAVKDIFDSTAYLDATIFEHWRYFPNAELNKFLAANEVFCRITTKYIGKAMTKIREGKTDTNANPTLLEQFFARGCDERVASVMAQDMIFAGIDTSSHAAAFFMYHLAMNPDVQEKLYKEVKTHLPNNDSRMDKNAFERMPYMKAAFKEALRLNPPAPANARTITEDIELGGYQIPAGTDCVPFQHIMCTSPVYVKDPNVFRPERFLKGSPQYEDLHPFLYLPFGHGPRMCVGRRFAEQEMYVFISKILQNFRIEWHRDFLGMELSTLTYPTSPLKFTFIDR
jgi:cytochrome P450 family 49 subfamily A